MSDAELMDLIDDRRQAEDRIAEFDKQLADIVRSRDIVHERRTDADKTIAAALRDRIPPSVTYRGKVYALARPPHSSDPILTITTTHELMRKVQP